MVEMKGFEMKIYVEGIHNISCKKIKTEVLVNLTELARDSRLYHKFVKPLLEKRFTQDDNIRLVEMIEGMVLWENYEVLVPHEKESERVFSMYVSDEGYDVIFSENTVIEESIGVQKITIDVYGFEVR